MPARCFLATFHPLIQTAAGRAAVQRYCLPPFIDGSCRREPDFESPFPSISALCRGGNFAPRLQMGDRVAYLTVKGRYAEDEVPGRRLVAILCIIHHPFYDHNEAARWYAQQGCPLPSNCLVPGNPPKAFELTNGKLPDELRRRIGAQSDSRAKIRRWDTTYRQRAKEWPVFLATRAEFLELTRPPQLQEADIVRVFGRVPATQTPPEIACDQLQRLVEIATE